MMQVQDSSDCCINSKFSCSHKGYFQDEYLSLFIKKLHPRSSIINRGYYIRFKAMEEVFLHWCSLLKNCVYEKYQILSLGSGYDSSYLRLKYSNKLLPGCHYVEIDFPIVLKKKLGCIQKLLPSQKAPPFENVPEDPAIVFHSDEYSMLGVDLTDIKSLQKYLNEIGVNYSFPTLVLSECSITYIDPKKSEDLIVWFKKNFPHSTFITYEQAYPADAFGLIMRNHFAQVGCALKSISSYPDEESQIQRFRKLNWPNCSAITMYDFYNSLLPAEKLRVKQLEIFDEYEMWHEKCHHYVLVWASQGMISTKLLESKKLPFGLLGQKAIIQKSLTWKCEAANDVVQRFGHQVVPISSSLLMLSGGFGICNKKHQKLRDIILYDTKLKKHLKMFSIESRMFHTMMKLSGNRIILLGGRSSPQRVFKDVLLINCFSLNEFQMINHDLNSLEECKPLRVSLSLCSQSMPMPTWRHSASLVVIEETECLVVFGGCSLDGSVTNQCNILNTKNWQWSEIKTQECSPSARHSHSAATYDCDCIIIAGGLSADEIILQSIHILSCGEFKWTTLQVSGLHPRYSHTSHVWNDHLFLIGGITSTASLKLGVGVLNLKTLQAIELSPPGQDPEYPILLSNHCSYLCNEEIVVIGGGGNCFSFGTHFNKKIVFFDIKSLLYTHVLNNCIK